MKHFVFIAPEATNTHLIKELGLMPFLMHKLYGFEGTVVCFPNPPYPYLESEVKGLKMHLLDRGRGREFMKLKLPILQYLKKFSGNIDILAVKTLTRENLCYLWYYKRLNPKGITYLKFDQDMGALKNVYLKYPLNRSLYKILLASVDLWSIESQSVYDGLMVHFSSIFKDKLIYLPNPIHGSHYINESQCDSKEKIILHVARMGTFQKATDLLLEAFYAGASPDWRLVLIGPEENDFSKMLSGFLDRRPAMRSRVEYLGNIEDREILFSWYRKSAIFTLPSRFESYGLVLAEAALSGCFLVASDLDAARDITDQWSFGMKVIPGDLNSLSVAFRNATGSEFGSKMAETSLNQRLHAARNFTSDVVMKKFHDAIIDIVKKRNLW